MILSGIYAIRNNMNGKMYIGSSRNIHNRWCNHKKALRDLKHHSLILQRAWNKYGAESFSFVILDYVEDVSELMRTEQQWIDTAKPAYNMQLVASNRSGLFLKPAWNKGLKMSTELRLKLSAAHTGKASPKKGKSYPHLSGRKQPPEAVAKTAAALLGRKLSAEHIQKISDSHKGKPSSRKGTTTSAAARERLVAGNKGKHIGRKHTEEAKANMSAAQVKYRAEHPTTHCRRGHELSERNVYVVPDGERRCRECQRIRKRKYLDKQRKPKS